jgi:hypothetical protein
MRAVRRQYSNLAQWAQGPGAGPVLLSEVSAAAFQGAQTMICDGLDEKNPHKMGLPDEQSRSVPLNLLLGGYQFSGAARLDPDLVATIKRTESRLVEVRAPQSFQTSRWKPAAPHHWAEMPDIPDFLRRAHIPRAAPDPEQEAA